MPISNSNSKPVVRVCQTCFFNLKQLSEDVARRVSQAKAVLDRPAISQLLKLPVAWDMINAINEETAEVARLQNGGCTHLN